MGKILKCRIVRKLAKALISLGSALLLAVRLPLIAAAMASVVTGDLVNRLTQDPYVRVLLSSATGILFFLLLYNVGELAVLITAVSCYGAIDLWLGKFEHYRKEYANKRRATTEQEETDEQKQSRENHMSTMWAAFELRGTNQDYLQHVNLQKL